MVDARFVKQNPDGSWGILREADRRSLVHLPTQRAAVQRARAILRRAGGGDVVVLDQEGKVTESARVARPTHRLRRKLA